MRRLLPPLCALMLLAPLATATARAQEGPLLTRARQLDMLAQHLAATAAHELQDGKLTSDQAAHIADFAVLARGFRFDLESTQYSSLQAQVAWAEVSQQFLATREALGPAGDTRLRNEVLRTHTLMNRLDERFGGAGFWAGANGWSG